MPEPRKVSDYFAPSALIMAAAVLVISFGVIALGPDFDASEALEVLVTGVAVVGVMGIAAGIAWGVGRAIELLVEDDSR